MPASRRADLATLPDPTPADLRPPSALLLMLEGRAPWEFAAMLALTPWLRRLPAGDGHPVFVFPGMGANDMTTLPLRRTLDALGYRTRAWGQGLNFGPRNGVLKRCIDDVHALADTAGEPVSLIGWSLGGIYAREIAKALPAETRSVITLGTPFSGDPRATNAWRVFELLSGQTAHDPQRMKEVSKPPPVPTTSIYSKSDGIVSWRCSLNKPGPKAENIEVHASHVGMGMNPVVLYAVADRLAQPLGAWKPFDASGLRHYFYNTHDPVAA
jgi:pimeloyl-ACP methyl ester carboxylesterase